MQMGVPPRDLFLDYTRELDTDKPTIAAVNGHAFAGGLRIARMVDVVVSTDHATHAISEPKVGRAAPVSRHRGESAIARRRSGAWQRRAMRGPRATLDESRDNGTPRENLALDAVLGGRAGDGRRPWA